MSKRENLAGIANQVGVAINDLRNALLEENYSYCSGLVRGAEEAIVIVMNALKDENVQEGEL